jgi:hypothetical protein
MGYLHVVVIHNIGQMVRRASIRLQQNRIWKCVFVVYTRPALARLAVNDIVEHWVWLRDAETDDMLLAATGAVIRLLFRDAGAVAIISWC